MAFFFLSRRIVEGYKGGVCFFCVFGRIFFFDVEFLEFYICVFFGERYIVGFFKVVGKR